MQRHREDNKMLTKLLPDQISAYWDIIRYAIEQSLPPVVGEGPDKMKKILMALLSGKAECWVSHTMEGENKRFEGVMVTRMQYDDISDTKNLLMYCAYGYEKITDESWAAGFATLAKYAKSKGCHRITTYTTIPYLIEMAKKFSADSTYTFITFPLT